MFFFGSGRIGFRSTIVLFAIFLVSLPGMAWAASERIEIQSLGLAITIPDGWHPVAAEAHRENLRRAFEGQSAQELIQRYASTPLIAFARYPEPHPRLNPSFRLTVRPAGALQGRPAMDVLDTILPSIRQLFDNFAIDQAPTEIRISGLEAAYVRVSYRLTVDGTDYPAMSEIWIVPRNAELFIVGAGWAPDEPAQTRAEIDSAVESLVIQDLRP